MYISGMLSLGLGLALRPTFGNLDLGLEAHLRLETKAKALVSNLKWIWPWPLFLVLWIWPCSWSLALGLVSFSWPHILNFFLKNKTKAITCLITILTINTL